MFYNFARGLVRLVFHLIYRIEVRGIENLPEDDGALVCPNHYNNFDPMLAAIVMKRKIRFMAKFEAFKNPIMKVILNNLGVFPVRRGEPDLNAVKTALKVLKDKQLVGLFPEGTRIKTGGFGKANPGVAMFSIKSGKPVVPVYISGNYKLFAKMKITFGKPFNFEVEKGKKLIVEDYERLSQQVMDEIARLKEENS